MLRGKKNKEVHLYMTDRGDETYKNSFCTTLINYLIKIDAIDKWKMLE